jgi:hypothetical protein
MFKGLFDTQTRLAKIDKNGGDDLEPLPDCREDVLQLAGKGKATIGKPTGAFVEAEHGSRPPA